MQTLISCANSHAFVGANLCVVYASYDGAGRVARNKPRRRSSGARRGALQTIPMGCSLEKGRVTSNSGKSNMGRTLAHIALLYEPHSLATQGEVTDVSPELCHQRSALVSHISVWCIAAPESIAHNTARHRHRAVASLSHRRLSSVWSADYKTCSSVRAPASITFITMRQWCRSSSSSRTFASAARGANFRHACGMTQPWVTHRAISDAEGCYSRVCL